MAKTEQGTSAIHIAAAEGFNDFITQLLDLGVQVDDPDKIGYTALFYAVLFSKLDTVQFLLEKGSKPGTQCEVGSTALLNSVLKGDLEITKLLYRFKDGHKFKAPYKLVHVASGLPSAESLKWLHEQGEDIREVDMSVIFIQEKRLGCLHYAAAGKSLDCLKYLLSKGLFVDFTDRSDSTALHTAVIQSDYDSVRALCEAGARIDLKNDNFLSPLDIAESMRDPKMISCLNQFKRKRG
jgi:ankyrin repeat protein